MTVKTVERELWTCNACGDEEITTGGKPKNWSTLWAWATRHPRDRPDRPSIVDMPVHTCHDCSSGPMYFVVRNLIEHMTDDKPREFKGERCKMPECTLPNKHEGEHKVPISRAVPASETTAQDTESCPIEDCCLPKHVGATHMNCNDDWFEEPNNYFDKAIVHKTSVKPPPLHGPTPTACTVPLCVAIHKHPGPHEAADGLLFDEPYEQSRSCGPHPDCICHETTVGKDGCPVHGKHYAHELGVDELAGEPGEE